MNRLKEMVLMLCLVLSGALCYAHSAARTENQKEIYHELTVEYGRAITSNPPGPYD